MLSLSCADTLHSVLPAIPFALINRVSGAPRNPLPVVGSGSRFSRADSEAISRIQSRMRYTLTASALPLLKPRLPVQPNGAGTLILPHPSTAHQVVLSQRQESRCSQRPKRVTICHPFRKGKGSRRSQMCANDSKG